MTMQRFEVQKADISKFRLSEEPLPELTEGEVLVKVDSFALTANNITYGIVGEKIGYWKFFPAADDWGVIPVWGFANVVESRHPDLPVGERLYGYFPMGSHLLMRPGGIKPVRMFDSMPHRQGLPLVYNAYSRTSGEPAYDASMDDERMLLYPLYATSYCLYDAMRGAAYHGASQIAVPSASSKTAIGLAYALRLDSDGPSLVGVTSSGNRAMVEALGLYDEVFTYDDMSSMDASQPTLIIDMSGNGSVLSDLHEMLGDNMRFTSNVGLTHYDANSMGSHFIRERSAMFFAPEHIRKRVEELGPGEFERRTFGFWQDAADKSRDWLKLQHVAGAAGLEDVYRQVLEGRAAPNEGIIVTL